MKRQHVTVHHIKKQCVTCRNTFLQPLFFFFPLCVFLTAPCALLCGVYVTYIGQETACKTLRLISITYLDIRANCSLLQSAIYSPQQSKVEPVRQTDGERWASRSLLNLYLNRSALTLDLHKFPLFHPRHFPAHDL